MAVLAERSTGRKWQEVQQEVESWFARNVEMRGGGE